MSAYLILLRHGQSLFNEQNRFTGLMDVELSENGVKEAKKAAVLMKKYDVDALFTSKLKRAINTADIVISDKKVLERFCDDALNERDYGDFSGQNKDEVKSRFGEEKFFAVRRGFFDKPANGESLKDVYDRVSHYFEKNILPIIKQGKSVLVVAHGNSLRALIKLLENISDDEISKVEIKTASPIVYKYEEHDSLFKRQAENI